MKTHALFFCVLFMLSFIFMAFTDDKNRDNINNSSPVLPVETYDITFRNIQYDTDYDWIQATVEYIDEQGKKQVYMMDSVSCGSEITLSFPAELDETYLVTIDQYLTGLFREGLICNDPTVKTTLETPYIDARKGEQYGDFTSHIGPRITLIDFMYVDKDCIITGEVDLEMTGVLTIHDKYNLELKKGWNVITSEMQSKDRVMERYLTVGSLDESIWWSVLNLDND